MYEKKETYDEIACAPLRYAFAWYVFSHSSYVVCFFALLFESIFFSNEKTWFLALNRRNVLLLRLRCVIEYGCGFYQNPHNIHCICGFINSLSWANHKWKSHTGGLVRIIISSQFYVILSFCVKFSVFIFFSGIKKCKHFHIITTRKLKAMLY